MVTQVVSHKQAQEMRAANQQAINRLKAQIRQMELQAANASSTSKKLKSSVTSQKKQLRSLLVRGKRLDKLLREGRVSNQGQTYVVQ